MTETIKNLLYDVFVLPIVRRQNHSTNNTRSLDEQFDPQRDFSTYSTLGKLQCEELGAAVLREAKRRGHFVALPVNSPVLDSSAFVPNRYIGDMIKEGYFIAEKSGDVDVVSPSALMCSKMYHQRRGENLQ